MHNISGDMVLTTLHMIPAILENEQTQLCCIWVFYGEDTEMFPWCVKSDDIHIQMNLMIWLQLLTSMVLLQVVTAVLLDEVEQARTAKPTSILWLEKQTPLQPLLHDLANTFEGPDDLHRRICDVFFAVCARGCKAGSDCKKSKVNRDHLEAGLAGLGYVPPIRFGSKDWNQQVVERGLCDESGLMGLSHFEGLLMEALRLHQVTLSELLELILSVIISRQTNFASSYCQ